MSRTRWLWSAWGFAALLAAYAAVHILVRVAVSPSVTIDDARETVFGQTLAWGYQPRQPPLYNWLVWAAFQGLGVSVLALALVKYAVLAVAYTFVYLIARRTLTDPRLATLATFALILLVPLGWILHEALTHSVAVLAACAATVYALIRLEASGGLTAYVGLGAALGLGLLSKFSYAVFAAALLLAALTIDRFRPRLLHPGLLVSLGVAAALVLPFATWYGEHGFAFLRMASAEARAGTGETHVAGVIAGLFYVLKVAVYYATPLWVVVLAVFPTVYAARPGNPARPSPGGRLIERLLVFVLGLLVAGALTTALTYLKFRWLIPGFFLLPLYAFVRLERTRSQDAGRLRRFAAVLVLAEIAVVGGILFRTYTGSLGGRPYKLNEPYDAVTAGLAARGFTRGTIVAGPGPVGGNLRLRFPDSRVLSLESPYYLPPEAGGGQCLIVWEQGPTTAVPPDLSDFLASRLDVSLSGDEPIEIVEAPYRFAQEHTRRVAFVRLHAGSGRCR